MVIPKQARIAVALSKEARAWREALRRSPESAHLHLIRKRSRLAQKFLRKFRRRKITAVDYRALRRQLFE